MDAKTKYTQKKHDWAMFAIGILLIISAFVVILWPGATLFTIAIFAGVLLLFAGISDFFAYGTLKGVVKSSGWYIVNGILDVILGILFLANPITTAAMLPWLAGIFVIAYGISAIIMSIGLSSFSTGWGVMVANGILSVIIGILFMVFPGSFILFLGIYLGVRGIALAIGGIIAPGRVSTY